MTVNSKALLDTNIIIHRENTKPTNYSIGQLFYWLDKLHYQKCIHPLSEQELRKHEDKNLQELYDAKIRAYTMLQTSAVQTEQFRQLLSGCKTTANDAIDNQLLCEVYSGRVGILITEDRAMRSKAVALGISDRVFSINTFVTKCTNENPALVSYKALSVKKMLFGDIDLSDTFFDSLRSDYVGFDAWFNTKSEEEAYVCLSDTGMIVGFLYLKVEGPEENYHNITPTFTPKKRLKIGTFKVETTGYRLGERFIKIAFDNALEQNVCEIYVTMYDNRPELHILERLFERWGFMRYGKKSTGSNEEIVLIKELGTYDGSKSPKMNFPNIRKLGRKFIVPIKPEYHTSLFPDSRLMTENEVDFLGNAPHKYALQKVYISFSKERRIDPGDLVLFYRMGENPNRKCYESVITSFGIIDEVNYNFSSLEEFLETCENRSVFTKEELEGFWRTRKDDLLVTRFIYVKSLKRRPILGFLWDAGIISHGTGPRPFTLIDDKQFEMILSEAETKIAFCED